MAHRVIGRFLSVATLIAAAVPLHAGGFELQWASARTAGMGGACVAAIEPSAISCNPGALALLPKKKGASVGLAATAFNESLYQGLPPGIGSGTAAEQKTPLGIIPHAYVTLPFPFVANSVLGVGIYSQHRMHTEWAEPDQFAGRFLANESEIDALDFTTAWSARITPMVGLGFGVTYRSSSVSVDRRVPATLLGEQKEIGSLSMKTDTERSLGWSVGMLIKPGPRFSAGFAYQSAIDTEYTGEGRLTQIPTGDTQFDQLIRASFPFDQDLPISTNLAFPSRASFGMEWSPTRAWLFALDASRTSWSNSNDLDIVFPGNRTLDTGYRFGFADTWTYRTGVRLRFPTGPQLRLGYALDKSPVPDATVGAFFPDADKSTFTAGFGLDWLDVAVGWTTYKQRIVTTNLDQFNGNYRANTWMAMLTVTK